MLEVTGIEVAYGAAPALRGVSVTVGAGEPVCVVGPNGAGKTTLINAIAGLHPVRSGRLSFAGRDITRLSSHRFCDAGIAIVPEGRRLFTGMTVQDNLEIGAHVMRARAGRAQSLESVLALFPALEAKLRSPAGSLSGGQQQMVAIGRALMARPTLLLLDEPWLGRAPTGGFGILRALRPLNASRPAGRRGEPNEAMAMDLASRAYVLEEGHIVAQGPAAQLMARPEIRQAYLGVTRQDDAVDSTRG